MFSSTLVFIYFSSKLKTEKMCIRDRYSLHIDANIRIIEISEMSAGTVVGTVQKFVSFQLDVHNIVHVHNIAT